MPPTPLDLPAAEPRKREPSRSRASSSVFLLGGFGNVRDATNGPPTEKGSKYVESLLGQWEQPCED